MYATNEFRKGLKVEIDGVPYEIVDFQHVSPGKGRAFTRTKLKNMMNQNILERTITSGDKLDRANTEQVDVQYLYSDSQGFHFMNQENFEQFQLTEEQLGSAKDFLTENQQLKVMFFNERAIGVELPSHIVAEVVKTDPAFKGDTVTGGTKPATIKPGAVVQVPFHIKEGDMIKVDTREYKYIEKAK